MFTLVFLVFLALTMFVEWYLAACQEKCVLAHRDTVPGRFAGVISPGAHRKAADYTVAKLRLGRWSRLWGVLLLLFWTLGGGLAWLDQAVRHFGWNELATGVAALAGFFFIMYILELPFDLWRSFGVEARFGFNRMSPMLFVSDQVRQMVLALAIGAPLAWAILWFMQEAGNIWWLYAWAVWTAFTLLMIWAFPALIAPLFNRFTPLEEGPVKARIEALLARCGFECRGLFVMDGSRRSAHGNAYFTGLGNARRIVLFDTLLASLDVEETEAVLAHELGHFRCGHIRKRLAVMSAMSLAGFALLGWLAGQPWFYAGLGVPHASGYAALLLFMLAAPVFLFWLGPVSNLFSRRHEFEADAYAAEHANGQKLITALVKMYKDNAATLTPDPAYSAWYDSHPSAPVRIACLESLPTHG